LLRGSESGPYHFEVSRCTAAQLFQVGALPIRRLNVALSLIVCAACATEGSKKELSDAKSQLRALREQNEQLEHRLARMEALQALGTAHSAAPASGSSVRPAPVSTPKSMPNLTVVKLKPKREPAPKLDVATAVDEPDSEDLGEILTEPSVPMAPDPRDASPAMLEKQYEDGVGSLKTGNVEGGVERLRAFALENPKHPRADNALYFAGLGLIGLTNHEEAASAFELLMQRYPASDSVVDAMLRLAECRVRLKQQDAARALYTKVISSYPGTAAATQAEQRLASLQTP
jgi:tol-pal system protein YbgF